MMLQGCGLISKVQAGQPFRESGLVRPCSNSRAPEKKRRAHRPMQS
jgi:hypothetical protein